MLIKVGDNISTDIIMPAGNRVLPYRSNIPAISEFVFETIDPEFPARAKEKGGGIVVGGYTEKAYFTLALESVDGLEQFRALQMFGVSGSVGRK